MTGGINNAGQVIGTMDVNDADGVRGYLRNSDGSVVDLDPAVQALGIPNYAGSMPMGISNSGLVVGMDESNQYGWVYNSNTGNATLLPGAVSFYPGGVNSHGQICGSVSYNDAGQNAIYTFNGDGNPVTTTPLSFVPNGINDLGDVVGANYLYNSAGQTIDLSTRVNPGAGVGFGGGQFGGGAIAINDAGQILVMNGGFGGGQSYLLTPATPGDANLDGQVDINDLTIVLANYGQTGQTWTQGEFTGDGTVDINDLTIVLAHYGDGVTAGSGIQATPEPATLTLLVAGLVGLLAYAWRKRK
jgi:hypothetical protein